MMKSRVLLLLLFLAEDFDRFMDNVEEIAAMYPMLVEWDNLRDQVPTPAPLFTPPILHVTPALESISAIYTASLS